MFCLFSTRIEFPPVPAPCSCRVEWIGSLIHYAHRGRRLNELSIPARRKPLFSAHQLRTALDPGAIENESHAVPAKSIEGGLPLGKNDDSRIDGPRPFPEAADRHASPRAPTKDLQPSQLGIFEPATSTAIANAGDGLSRELHSSDTSTTRGGHGKVNGTSANDDQRDVLSTGRVTLPSPVDSAALSRTPRVDGQLTHASQAHSPKEPGGRPSPKDASTGSDHRTLITDSARFTDALSSPGSTAHSMLTPALHDASADTSPDNEGPQYMETAEKAQENGTEVEKRDGFNRTAPSAGSPPLDVSLPPAISGVEAQLLQESAAAQLSHSIESTTRPSRGGPGSPTHPLELPVPQLRGGLTTDPQPVSVTTQGGDQQRGDRAAPGSDRILSMVGVGGTQNEDASLPIKAGKPDGLSQPDHNKQPAILRHPPPVAVDQESRDAGARTPRPQSTEITASNVVSAKPQLTDPTPTAEALGTVSGDANGLRGDSTQDNEASTPQAPSVSKLKLLANKSRDKRRKRIPTVIFGKQPAKRRTTDDSSLVVSRQRPGQLPSDDYFTPLFIEGFTRQSGWMKPIEKLLNQANKTISTHDQYISILDHQACKILRRVYHLQQHDKWSLRQPVRCPEPTRPASHWDLLLQEMKWMRTDFRQEGKWKRAVARNLAYDCAEWVHSSPAERRALQVNAVIPPLPVPPGTDAKMADAPDAAEEPLPDLVHSDSPRDNEEEPLDIMVDAVAPSALFALQNDEVVFSLQRSKTADLLLENLPMYGSPLQVPKFDVIPDYDPDAKWKRPAVPVSKFVEGELVLTHNEPPRRRSRFDYAAEDEDDDGGQVIFGGDPDPSEQLTPENSAVALFSPEMKLIRDRLHAAHQFRPPTEYPMPPQSFFESRTASQWTYAEDEQLKSLVRECSYNWSLVSAMASTTSRFASGAERRTPWECFERWVSLGSLEGLPNDMARTPYFKAYQSRIDAAQRNIAQQNQAAQQQVGPNGAVTPVPRRRATTSVRVERRRNQKHLALIDAMRKLAKKRETAAQKAQNAASIAATRKANEVPRQPMQNKTPRDYSIMRWERDQQLAERMAAYAARHVDVNARRLVRTNSNR